MAEMTFNFPSLKIDKRFHTIDVSGFADFIIMQRYKFSRSLPPAYRPSEKFSDLWLPTTKLMRSPIEPHRIRVPDNMMFRNGQNFSNSMGYPGLLNNWSCVQLKQKNSVSTLSSK